ncbi:C39 family peptidase [Plantactinospora solaniradicis]|uniref:C39 family peptidase n=1 Tax=Plantactinospora solaniradicis TaxID=1723736 RepID=A0ABW1KG79_9ACTN
MLSTLLRGARWLTTITPSTTRRAALATAGLAVIGGTVAGPAVALGATTQDVGFRAPTAKELSVDYQAQPNFYYCGPAATRIALTASGQAPSQDDLAARLGTDVNGTDSAEDTTRVLNSLGRTDFYRTRSIPENTATPEEMDRLQADVTRAVAREHPVVVNVIGTAVDTEGVAHSYDGGHYLTVVGYQDEGRMVKIADPADVNGDSSYWMSTINLANWAASRGYSG